MKKNIIIFGVGYYGKNTYWRLKNNFNIKFFADNNEFLAGKKYDGVKIILGESLPMIDLKEIDIIICSTAYFEIASQIELYGINEYYVMLDGFLYFCDTKQIMMPIELNEQEYYKKSGVEKNVLFLQNVACSRTHKIAQTMKNAGYEVFLLYTLAPPYGAFQDYSSIYSKIWGFSSAEGIVDFIDNSDFDIVHSSNEPDTLTCIVQKTKKPIIFDVHDMQSLRADIDIDTIVLEYIANRWSDGNLYVSQHIVDIAHQKFDIDKDNTFYLENYPAEENTFKYPLPKKRMKDGNFHCVYEGAIVGDNRFHHRYFDEIWKKITEAGVHIHFYSSSDISLCRRLEGISELIHYEGSKSGDELIYEMTQYDCGLALFNTCCTNRKHLEETSITKVYDYINAKIPILSYGIQNLRSFLESEHIGAELDFNKDIVMQVSIVSGLDIDENYLTDHMMTMKANINKLCDFYSEVITNKQV